MKKILAGKYLVVQSYNVCVDTLIHMILYKCQFLGHIISRATKLDGTSIIHGYEKSIKNIFFGSLLIHWCQFLIKKKFFLMPMDD